MSEQLMRRTILGLPNLPQDKESKAKRTERLYKPLAAIAAGGIIMGGAVAVNGLTTPDERKSYTPVVTKGDTGYVTLSDGANIRDTPYVTTKREEPNVLDTLSMDGRGSGILLELKNGVWEKTDSANGSWLCMPERDVTQALEQNNLGIGRLSETNEKNLVCVNRQKATLGNGDTNPAPASAANSAETPHR